MPSALCSAAISSGEAGSGVYTRPAKNGYFSGKWMWVWQSQACSGTSKFTGVDGCAALANAVRFCIAMPAATDASKRVRRLSMVVSSFSSCWLVGGARALHGSGSAGCACGKERDDRRHQRTGGEEIEAGFEALGGILDPADDERAEIAAEIADGVDHG